MKANDYAETNAQIIHLHQGGFELDYSLEKNNKVNFQSSKNISLYYI